MSLIDLIRRKEETAKRQVALPRLIESIEEHASDIEAESWPPELLRARMADLCRDASTPPLEPAKFNSLTSRLDGPAWQRLELCLRLIEAADHASLLKDRTAESIVAESALSMVGDNHLLTMELIVLSKSRAEEFARNFAQYFKAGIVGERTDFSKARLKQLDYRRLLAEAERAKGSAEARMAYLKKLQAKQDAQMPRRGKN